MLFVRLCVRIANFRSPFYVCIKVVYILNMLECVGIDSMNFFFVSTKEKEIFFYFSRD